jgi:hypothetical protein
MTPRIAPALALTILGCAGTETGNPPFAPDIEGGVVSATRLRAEFAVASGTLAFRELSLLDCGGRRWTLVQGGTLDLVDGALRGGPSQEVPAQTYCGFVVQLVQDGATLTVDGTRASDGASVRVLLAPAADKEVVLSGVYDVTPEVAPLLLTVEPLALLARLEPETLSVAPDGVAYVDLTRQPERSAHLLEDLGAALTLRRDLDADGMLSEAEKNAEPLATRQ